MNMDEKLKDTASHNDSVIAEDEPQCVKIEFDGALQADGLNVIDSSAFPGTTSTRSDEGRTSRPSSEPVDRTSLELKLDALIEEMRVELAAEHAAAAESKGLAVHVTGFCAPTSQETREMEAPKVIVCDRTDPREEMTVVGRRAPNGEAWIFDGVEEDAPTNPMLPPMSGNVSTTKKPSPEWKNRRLVVALSIVMLGLSGTWFVMAHVISPARLTLANQPPPPHDIGTLTDETQNPPTAPPTMTVVGSAGSQEPAVDGNHSGTSIPPTMANNGNQNVAPPRSKNQSSRKNKQSVITRPVARPWPAPPPRNAKVPPEAPLEPKRLF